MAMIQTMKAPTFLATLCLLGTGHNAVLAEDFQLTPKILAMSDIAAKLSALAYAENATAYANSSSPTGFSHPDYEEIKFYTVEPDQALIAKKDGHCYASFRGTTVTGADWAQNVNIKDANIYKDNNETTGEFCETRKGFSDFLRTDTVAEAVTDLARCAATCADPTDCVVLTGHSQGGASAAVASILLYSYQPYVIPFGMPPAVDKGCDLIPSEKMYRFVNMRRDADDDVGFDLVPYSPTLVSRSVHYGHYIIVGPDPTSVKYLGIDQENDFKPDIYDRTDINAHTISGQPYGYSERVAALLATATANATGVTMTGFRDGTICEEHYNELCFSGSCRDFACTAKVQDLCIPESCKSGEDCQSGTCIYGACAAGEGMVQNGCPCRIEKNCESENCDQAITTLNWKCAAPGAGGGIFDVTSSATEQAVRSAVVVAGLAALL